MKRHLQCAEQAQSASNLTKYCACHEICKFKLSAETPWIASANRKTIRTDPRIIRRWSEDDPTIKSSSRTRRFGDLTRPILETILYWKIQHFALRLSPKMSPNAAPATKTHTPTSPNTAPATQNESHDWSTSHMKRHLQCAEQAQSASNLTKYCACHEICKFKLSAETPWIASANRKTIRTDPRIIRRWSEDDPTIKSSSRTRRFGDLTRPILETILYWKIQHFALRLSPKMSPNAAPATKTHTPTSPNTAPATQNESHDWSTSHMKRHLQCAEQAQSASNLTKYCACHEICKFKLSAETPWIASANRKTIRTDPRIIRRWSEDDPTIKSSSRTRRFGDLTRPILETILYWKIQHFALRLSPKMSPNAAPATKTHTPTSPNTAPATQNESHDWSTSHMKRQLQCAEQAQSASNLTKYCACHEICKFKLSAETPWIASANRKTIRTDPRIIRGWSEDDPTIKSSSRTRRFGDLTRPILETILYWKIQHFALRLSPKMSPNAAPATKTHTPTSPNTAPATQNESHDWSTSHMKRHLQCAEQAQSASNLTKYCACHEICKFKLSAETPWIASANRKTIRTDPRIIRGWSDDKIVISHPPLRRPYSSDLGDDFVLKNTTFRAPAIPQNVTKCCACHENSHSNFTKYCACHLFSLLSLGIYSL